MTCPFHLLNTSLGIRLFNQWTRSQFLFFVTVCQSKIRRGACEYRVYTLVTYRWPYLTNRLQTWNILFTLRKGLVDHIYGSVWNLEYLR